MPKRRGLSNDASGKLARTAAPEEKKELSILDLPDKILILIFKYLDLPTQLKLGSTCKKLNELQLSVKNKFKSIYIDILASFFDLHDMPTDHISGIQSQDFDQMEQGFRRLSRNTSVDEINIEMHNLSNVRNRPLINSLLNFEAGSLCVGKTQPLRRSILPQVNLSYLLKFAQNITSVYFEFHCTSVTAKDLCTLRKKMFEGDCKLKDFTMKWGEGMDKSFLDACLGVTFDEVVSPRHTQIYRTADESIELFMNYSSVFNSSLNHYESDIHTEICPVYVKLEKCEGVAKADEKYTRIEWNHLYVNE